MAEKFVRNPIKAYNPLYHEIYQEVAEQLDARGNASGAFKRGSDSILKWSYGKNAYATLMSVCQVDPNLTLYSVGTGTYNRVKKVDDLTIGIDGIESYELGISTNTGGDVVRYNIPRTPTLQSVNISNQGKMGSLQNASFEIIAYNIEQLEIVEELLLIPGTDVVIQYGWSQGAHHETENNKKTCHDSFKGTVHNFTWNMNPDGSFAISGEAVGKGFFSVAQLSTPRVSTDDFVEDQNKTDIKGGGLPVEIEKDLSTKEIKSMKAFDTQPSSRGVGLKYSKIKFVYDDNLDSMESIDKNSDGEITASDIKEIVAKQKSESFYYLTLNEVIRWFNEVLLFVANSGRDTKVRYSSDLRIQILGGTVGDVKVPPPSLEFPKPVSASTYITPLRSCIPTEILFSDDMYNGVYGTQILSVNGVEWHEPSFKQDLGKEGIVNLGEILISTDLIVKTYKQIDENANAKPEERSIATFLGKLFERIAYASGNIYQLSLITPDDYMGARFKSTDFISGNGVSGYAPKSANSPLSSPQTSISDNGTNISIDEYEIIVVDKNDTGAVEVKPYVFSNKLHKSIIRQMSMDSKIPNALQTAMYAGGRTQISDGMGGRATKEFSKVQVERFEDAKTSKENNLNIASVKACNEKRKKIEEEELKKAIANGKIEEPKPTLIEELEKAVELMGQIGETPYTSNKVRDNLVKIKSGDGVKIDSIFEGTDGGAGSWLHRNLYPINLSLTIDGISGFRFGDCISYDYVPSKYKYFQELDGSGNDDGSSGKKIDTKLRVTFVVTKVSHSIADNVWTTTLETQCRIGMPVSAL